MIAFLLGSDEGKKASSVTTFSGVVILMGYMAFDSFTSSWQGALFTEYKMSSIQMMAGVNLFSCLLTSVSLMQQGIFYSSLVFMSQYSAFFFACIKFHHPLSPIAIIGILIIFSALFLRIYCGYRMKSQKKVATSGSGNRV